MLPAIDFEKFVIEAGDIVIMHAAKHLPGRHDQNTHGRRYRTLGGKREVARLGGIMQLRREAKKQGFKGRLEIIPSRKFTVNGKTFQEGAHYDPNTNTIAITDIAMNSLHPERFQGIFAHEFGHAKFEKALELVHKEAIEIDTGALSILDASPLSKFYWNNIENRELTVANHVASVSNYAKQYAVQYLKKFPIGGMGPDFDLMVNEGLAGYYQYVKNDINNPKDKPYQIFFETLTDLVDEHYAKG